MQALTVPPGWRPPEDLEVRIEQALHRGRPGRPRRQAAAAADIGEHPLRLWRREQEMPLKQLAARAGVSVAVLSRIETDQQLPTPRLIARLVELTGLSADVFIERVAEGAPKPPKTAE